MLVNSSANQIPEQTKGKMFGTTTTWILVAVCCLMIAIQTASAGESNEQYVTLNINEMKQKCSLVFQTLLLLLVDIPCTKSGVNSANTIQKISFK